MAVATNDNVIQFAAPTPAAWGTITHLGFHKSATGTTTFAGGSALDTSRATSIGADVEIPAGDLTITIPDGELTTYGVGQAFDGLLGTTGSIYISLHTASPGSNGANEVSGNAYARIAVAVSDITVS